MQYRITYKFYWRPNGITRSFHGMTFVDASNETEAILQTLRPRLKVGEEHNLFFVFDSIRPVGRLRVE